MLKAIWLFDAGWLLGLGEPGSAFVLALGALYLVGLVGAKLLFRPPPKAQS